MTGKRTSVLVRLDPGLLERIDAAREGSRNDWCVRAFEARLGTVERLSVARGVVSSAEAKAGVKSRSWR